jgi:hypothetical protein
MIDRGSTALRAAVLLVLGLAATACSDSTGPRDAPSPGRELVDASLVCSWTWIPGGQEILYSTVPGSGGTSGCLSLDQPTTLNSVDISTGRSRVVVPALAAPAYIVGQRFAVVGQHVYFQGARPASNNLVLYRAPLGGLSQPEIVIDSIDPVEPDVVVSPDEHMLAWLASYGQTLVTMDLGTGVRRSYPLLQQATRIVWAPTALSVVVDQDNTVSASGIPVQWVDLTSGAVRLSTASADEITLESSRDYRWEGDTPFLYVGGPNVLARYSLATGAREILATLSMPGTGVGWRPDYESAVVATTTCLDASTGPLGSGDCLRWRNSIDRVAQGSGTRTPVLRYDGPGEILGRLSPMGDWLAYVEHHSCGCYMAGDGLYLIPVP